MPLSTQSGVAVSPIAFRAYLVLDGASYVLNTLEVTYIANGISMASCQLAVGVRGDRSRKVGADVLSVPRGTPAQIVIDVDEAVTDPVNGTTLLEAGQQTLFNGLLDDTGPSDLSRGSFSIEAKLLSKLAILASGTLQLNKLICSTYLDTSVPLAMINTQDRTAIAPGFVVIPPDILKQDMWQTLVKVFNAIANTAGQGGSNNPQALQQYLAFFGDGVNNKAIEVINQIKGVLTPGQLNNDAVINSLANYLTRQFTQDFRMESFLARIINLGQEFKFRLFEGTKSIQIVPYSPFFPSNLAMPVYPTSVYRIARANREPNNILGMAITVPGPAMVREPNRSEALLVGRYKRPNATDTPLGSIVSFPGPSWLTKTSEIGNESYTIVDFDLANQIGDGWAKETCLEMAYRGSGVQVACPFRTDIGVLSPVQIIYPSISGAQVPPSVYGSVQMVRLAADAVQRSASTLLEVGYVRSQSLQTSELEDYKHPLWSEQYRGGRLTE